MRGGRERERDTEKGGESERETEREREETLSGKPNMAQTTTSSNYWQTLVSESFVWEVAQTSRR